MSIETASPAPLSAALALAPGASRMRKALLWQCRKHPSIGFRCGQEWLAIAMLRTRSCGRLELALMIGRAAIPHMRALVRQAHLTLSALCQHHCVFAVIHPANVAGQRMAALIGMKPVRGTGRHWMRV